MAASWSLFKAFELQVNFNYLRTFMKIDSSSFRRELVPAQVISHALSNRNISMGMQLLINKLHLNENQIMINISQQM